MYRLITLLFVTSCLCFSAFTVKTQASFPNLHDFWAGQAQWQMEIADIGLPIGESDTIALDTATYRSYLHASQQSAGIIDQCGLAVPFPGCLTLWTSTDQARSFTLTSPICLLSCETCPCDDQRDHISAQQYPRVARADDGTWYMVYEWHAQVMLRRSEDGITWSDWDYLLTPGGTWSSAIFPCSQTEHIGAHPHIRGQAEDCIVGAPPGLFVEGDWLYVFVMAGSAPAHMRCYKGNRHADLSTLQRCETDPLFTGATTYGATDASGAAAAHWDFRYLSSADILRVGEYYYMVYEGIRGPSELEFGRDNQFGLGFARSRTLDHAWETYPDNPIIMGLVDNWGIGHADLLIIDGITYLISATSTTTRGRYRLVWSQ